MFSMNKETIMMISIAVALFAVFYLYRDVQQAKTDLKSLLDKPELPLIPKKKAVAPATPPVPVTPPPTADDAN
jgi:hypothetical protein